mmetsp:Transcript_20491/g.51147  ORF Transcript_20491/g.51147 Transcript_20491/m.51147 type:complete len:249 (+) Transcript_20491:1470-2216(+)
MAWASEQASEHKARATSTVNSPRSLFSSAARRLMAVLVVLAHSLTLRAALIVGSVAVVANVLAAPAHYDHLGMLVGRAALSGVVVCVDSGATVSCLSENLALSGRLDFQIVQRNPHRRLRVASDQVLDIVAMGNLRFSDVAGFRVVDGKRVPAVGDATFRNVAVVRGLSENTVLLSVRPLLVSCDFVALVIDADVSSISDSFIAFALSANMRKHVAECAGQLHHAIRLATCRREIAYLQLLDRCGISI